VGFSAPANVIADPEFASRALRATVRSVTRTLVRKHADILLRLSGGLDSSIVAGCLKDLDRATIVSAYVGFAPGGKSDERRWARLSARDAGFDLIEWPIEAHSVSLERTVAGIKASVEPTSILLRTIRGEIEKQLLARRPYSAVISGHGGDSVFGAEAIRQTLDDFLRLRGLRRETLGIASSIGAFTDSLAWTVLAGSLRRWIRGSRMRDFEQPLGDWQSLAAEHVRARREARTFPHPWFDDYPDVPWPVIRRVGALILPTEFYDPTLSLDIETPLELAPLYSQPVTELSLRIPLYLHFDCGVERGLARRAFSQDVPAAILDRLWKDRAPGHIETVMLANRGLFRETLLGGAIAQAGLIDSATIAQMLDGRFSRGSYFVGQLFSLLDLEHWIRGFSTPKSAFQFDAATVECQVRSAGRG
jgi:asparagine synthase (glutamine-hydrolysing)